MKKLIGLVILAIGMNAFAQETEMSSAKVETKIENTVAIKEQPAWKFEIGKSEFTSNYDDEKGKGLTLGMTYSFNNFFAVGGSFTQFKTEQVYTWQYYDGQMSTVEKRDLRFFTLQTELTPIRYGFGNFYLAGSLLLGVATKQYTTANDSTVPPFYGAAVTLSIGQQIGFSMGMKVSDEFASMSSISMIGYY